MTRIADLLECDFSRPYAVSTDREDAVRHVLRKKASQESILRKLFVERGAALIQNVRLERCSRRTVFDEDQFVRFYPYLPHLIDLSMDIAAGKGYDGAIGKQCFEMLASERTRLADRPIGTLVSVDRIYEVMEETIPPEQRKDILEIRQRFDGDKDYPGMAARVAKAVCLLEFVKTDLPRTTTNIAALLIQRVNETPPTLAVAALLQHMKEGHYVRETEGGWTLYDMGELRRAVVALQGLANAVGAINPRPPGWHNELAQLLKKLLARMMTWHTRPVLEFNVSVSRSLDEIVGALERLSANLASDERFSANAVALERLSMDVNALEGRLAQAERKRAAFMEFVQTQFDRQHEQMMEIDVGLPHRNSRFYFDANSGSDRTAYVIGLFGTGRRYINEVIVQNIGERAKYFRDTIRLHPGPTPMIYSGHATIRYVSRAQELPVVMSRILEAVGSGFANLIFVYRHPLDSLLTNWIWWRTYIRDNRSISGISQIYGNVHELCRDLEENFLEFMAFAGGDPDFFVDAPGQRFLSFAEFVEETELHFQSATLALRLEDFMIDASKEFAKIGEVMSVDLDLSRVHVAPPKTRPYGYLAVQERVPRFREFIDGLDAATTRRIEKIGYVVNGRN